VTGTGRYLTPSELLRLDQGLSKRDRNIVRSVDRLRLVTGGQLARLFFAGSPALSGSAASRARSGRRALGRLVLLGLLRRLERRVGGIRAGSDGFIYEVDAAGQRLCAYWSGEGLARTRPAHEPAVQFIQHRVAISEVYVRLSEAARDHAFELVSWQSEPAAWRPFLGAIGARQMLKPDAYVVLASGDDELVWFIEVDRGTISTAALRRQLAAYVAYWRGGHPGEPVMPRVLWLVPDDARAERLRQLGADTSTPATLFAVATEATLLDELLGTAMTGARS